MAEQFKNLASTTLSGDINDTTTSVGVVSAMGFTGGDFRVLIDSEIMKVTGVSGTTFTVVRHQEGTSAASHTNTTPVYHVLTAGGLNAHDQNDLAAYDTFANRPAAGTPGRIYLPTDGLFLERDNGSIWEKFGPIWPMTPPAAADFPTWLNQGTATFTDNKGAPFFYCPNQSTALLRCRLKDYPTPPFTVEIAFLPNAWSYSAGSHVAAGFGIRDTVSGKLQCYGAGGNITGGIEIKGYNYSSPTASSGAGITGWPANVHWSEQPLVWMKYVDNTTNRIISLSADGYTWTQLVSLAVNDYLVPNQIGIVTQAITGYAGSPLYRYIDCGMTVLSWRQY